IDYQPDKMRLDVEIKGLFQKKEQEIVGILEKFKNKVLKKDKAVTKYLGVQYIELICIIREIIEEYDYIQHKIARDTLLQLECGTHDYGTKELQATTNGDVSAYYPCKYKLEARELQEEIVRINRTTHLLERESPTDIEISEKKEVSPIIANFTNEVEVMQNSLQSMSIQEENKKSLPMKVGYQRIRNNKVACIKIQCKDHLRLEALKNSWALHYEAGKLCQVTPEKFNADLLQKRNIYKATLQNIPRTALEFSLLKQLKYHKAKLVFISNNKNRNPRSLAFIYFAKSQDLNKAISQTREEYNPNKENFSEIEPSIKTEHSNTRERIYRKQHKQPTLHQRRGRSLPKLELMKHNRGGLPNKQENTKTPCDMNNTENLLKGIRNAKIQSSEMITNSNHAIISALINLDHLIFHNNMAKTRAKGIKRTVYLYEEHKEQPEAHMKKTEEKKKSKTYKAIVQPSKWIRKGKKNQNQKIDAALKKEMTLSIREINKKLNIEIASVGEQWLSELIQNLKGWWMILSQKDKTNKNYAKLKKIQERINDRCEMIDGKQDKILASLLDKPFNKIKINKLVKENGLQRSLLLERDEILAHTKEHFKRQISFKPNSVEWKIKGEGPTILELLSSKLNFKAAKTLEKFNIFYANQLILQDDKTLVTWSQLKLIKGATKKGRKPIWFEHLESIHFTANRKIKDWVIAKEINREPILEYIIKKNSNSVLIKHWKELDHLVPSQSKLEKENTGCSPQGCNGISIENDQNQNKSVAGWEERTTKQSRKSTSWSKRHRMPRNRFDSKTTVQ
ncbi:6816_t:CDS:10, partial [Gigaspora margarita]